MNPRHGFNWLTAGIVVGCLTAAGCGGGGEAPAPASSSSTPASSEAPGTPAPAPSSDPAPTGSATISGTVNFEGEPPPLRPLKMDADPGCAKKHDEDVMPEVLVLGEGNTMGNVFVHVKNGLPAGSYPVPSEQIVLDQDGCQYKPHVLGVRAGQSMKILNSDGLLHNIHSLPERNQGFNRAMPANVTEFEYTFDKPEFMFKIKCDVHPWMGAWISVMEHPYFEVTQADGTFSLTGLPAGTYEVEAWHERLGTQTATVEVADGGSSSADFTFTR